MADNDIELPDYDYIWGQVYGDMQKAGPVHRHMWRIVKRLLAQIEYKSVLDVGCGPGLMYYLYFLNSHKRGDLLVVLATV